MTIPDRGLEVRIREAIGKRRGDLYESDLEAFEKLDAWKSRISDLTGLGRCPNLIRLKLSTNSISDISPLAGATGLLTLYASYNSIADLSALSGMRHLTTLWLRKKQNWISLWSICHSS